MPPPQELILGVLIPMAVSFAILLVGWFVGRIVKHPQYWAAPLAIAVGWFAGYWYIQGRLPQYNPFQATTSVVWLGLPIALLAAALSFLSIWAVVRWIGIVASALVVMYFLEKPHLEMYEKQQLIVLFAAAGLVPLVWRLLWEHVGNKAPAATAPLGMTAVATGVAVLLLMSGAMSLGRIGGALTAAIGPIFVMALLTDRTPFTRGGVFIASLLTLGLLAASYYYSELYWPHGLLVLASPLTLLLTFVGPLSKLTGWKRAVITTVLVMIPVLTALAWATPTFTKTMSETTDSYSD